MSPPETHLSAIHSKSSATNSVLKTTTSAFYHPRVELVVQYVSKETLVKVEKSNKKAQKSKKNPL